jgi:hypothetical protein
MKRVIILSVGWLAATVALLYAMLRLSLQWNFFDWSPKWDSETIAEAIGVAAVLAAIWFLGKASRDKISRVVSVLACLSLVGLAMVWFPAEPTTQGFLGRSQPSPMWFRGGRVLQLCVPGVFWFRWIWRHLAQDRSIGRPLLRSMRRPRREDRHFCGKQRTHLIVKRLRDIRSSPGKDFWKLARLSTLGNAEKSKVPSGTPEGDSSTPRHSIFSDPTASNVM